MNSRLKSPVPVAQTPHGEPRGHTGHRVHSGCEPDVYLEDLVVGDAGIGGQFFMNKTYYSQLIPNTADARYWQTDTDKVGMTQARSTDSRPRLFQISFFSRSLFINLGAVSASASTVLAYAEINQTVANLPSFIRTQGVSGPFQGYASISDPSGGREQVLDVIGKRSFDVVADAAEIGFYIPENSYQIDSAASVGPLSGDGPTYNGLVALTSLAVRIAPVTGTTTQVRDQYTESFDIAANGATTRIPFPPSAVAVEFFWPVGGASSDLTATFAINEQLFPDAAKNYNPSVSDFVIAAAGGASGEMKIPNATGVAIVNVNAAVTYATAVFTLEP